MADDTNEAIRHALETLPDNPSVLLRVNNGHRWYYIAFESALEIAGYSIKVVSRLKLPC